MPGRVCIKRRAYPIGSGQTGVTRMAAGGVGYNPPRKG
jgi:hypothetical protein